MAVTLESVIGLVLVSFLWGTTNPFMKKGAKGVNEVRASSTVYKFFKELSFLFSNSKYLIPFLVNQAGSVLYFLTLQNVDLSLAVPVTNSLTFVFTALTGWILGEDKAHKSTYIGMILIIIGTTLCCIDKMNVRSELEVAVE